MECPYCKKSNIDFGLIRGGYRTYFFSDENKDKLIKNPVPIKAYLCKECGMIYLKAEKKIGCGILYG